VELTGLEPRRSDLARGIVIARSKAPLDPAAQEALWAALSTAGVTETERHDTDDGAEPEEQIARQWLAAPWMPPAPDELESQRAAFMAAAATFGIEQIWCVKVETGIDGVTWMEITAAEPSSEGDDDASPTPDEPQEVVDAIFEENEEVLYAAPDAPEPAAEGDASGEDDTDDEFGDDDEDMIDDISSRSRSSGIPRSSTTTTGRASASR
jgi:hypothetical protein